MKIQALDALLSLSFALHSGRGVYAVLIGSGLSTAAGIPTGYQVVLDLIRRIARTRQEDCEPDPEAWYHRTLGEQPTYPGLLKRLARTPAERQQILRAYFEPSPDGKAKQPTKAHDVLAQLVKSGYVRVILTTNFDRLIEHSLEANGVSPTTISRPTAAVGATPLTHAPCTLIKLHGDYLDPSIKNTPEELQKYDRKIDRLLDRILDEYGLIVCGWSADWDDALREAIERCKSRRYTTFWAVRGSPSDAAARLIHHRGAEIIPIKDADAFFFEAHQKVLSLASFDAQHPLSPKIAAATLKRMLPDEKLLIELYDLVNSETERVVDKISDSRMPTSTPVSQDEARTRLQRYEEATATLRALVTTGCRWGAGLHLPLWTGALDRLLSHSEVGGYDVWAKFRRYPALLTLYSSGIVAVAASNLHTLRALFFAPRMFHDGEQFKLIDLLYPASVMESDVAKKLLPSKERARTPLSDHLFDFLREPLREFLPADRDYEYAFNRFEYLLSLVHVHEAQARGGYVTVPIGRFGWQGPLHRGYQAVAELQNAVENTSAQYPLIDAALFPSSIAFKEAVEIVRARVAQLPWQIDG